MFCDLLFVLAFLAQLWIIIDQTTSGPVLAPCRLALLLRLADHHATSGGSVALKLSDSWKSTHLRLDDL